MAVQSHFFGPQLLDYFKIDDSRGHHLKNNPQYPVGDYDYEI